MHLYISYTLHLIYILKDNYSHFISIGHTENVVLVGKNVITLMQRLFFIMLDNTLKMDKWCLIIVVAFCRRLIFLCVKSFYIIIPIDEILTSFLHCIQKGTFPLYKLLSLFDFFFKSLQKYNAIPIWTYFKSNIIV